MIHLLVSWLKLWETWSGIHQNWIVGFPETGHLALSVSVSIHIMLYQFKNREIKIMQTKHHCIFKPVSEKRTVSEEKQRGYFLLFFLYFIFRVLRGVFYRILKQWFGFLPSPMSTCLCGPECGFNWSPLTTASLKML